MKHRPHSKNMRPDKPFYIVAVCFAVDVERKKALLLRRSSSEVVHPGKWAPLGGKLEWGDLMHTPPSRSNGNVEDWEHIIEQVLKREAKEEANIEIGRFHYLDSVGYVRPDGMPSVCFKFAGEYLGGEVQHPTDFDAFQWFGEGEVEVAEAVLGVPEELDRAIRCFK